MTKQEIIDEVKALNLPKNSYVVFGSCPLAALGIREANDIDMMVTPEVLEELKKAGWRQVDKGKDDAPFVHGVFEAHTNWDFSTYSPTLEYLLAGAMVVDDIPFASLDEVRKWKAATVRPKDMVDVNLIDEYLASHQAV